MEVFKIIFNNDPKQMIWMKPEDYYREAKVMSMPKKVYRLIRIKSRLRVSFIGYSYNIKQI